MYVIVICLNVCIYERVYMRVCVYKYTYMLGRKCPPFLRPLFFMFSFLGLRTIHFYSITCLRESVVYVFVRREMCKDVSMYV